MPWLNRCFWRVPAPRPFRLVGGGLVVAGCVSVVRRRWWCWKITWCAVVKCGEIENCDVVTRGEMWCDVTWCDVRWGEVMWCDVMWWQVLRCGAFHGKNATATTRYYSIPRGTTQYFSVLPSIPRQQKLLHTATHYKVLQYYKMEPNITKKYRVLESTAWYLLHDTRHDRKVRLRTAKWCSVLVCT